jgi:hypothetical protein
MPRSTELPPTILRELATEVERGSIAVMELSQFNSHLACHYREDLKATFPKSAWWDGGSFWMRRRSPIT